MQIHYFLKRFEGNDLGDEALRPCHEAQIDELRQRATHYARCLDPETFPFQVGDIVTPVKGASVHGAGEPHIVLEINLRAAPNMADTIDPGMPSYGARYQMRVLCLSGHEHYCAYWVQAWQFELYISK